MTEYPKYVPDEFIRYHEFELISDEEKNVSTLMIFDKRMSFSWNALSNRANECRIPYFFYQTLVMKIVEIMKGPTDWDLLTQKEKESKISRISKLSLQLMSEVEGTPLDEFLTEYFNHSFYINWFKENNKDEHSIKKMDFYLDKFCEKTQHGFISKPDNSGSIAWAWQGAGVLSPSISSLLCDLNIKAEGYECESIIKRKVNPSKSFFVRKLSAFFEESFGLKLYALTASISSLFLNETISQEDVISITK